MGYTLRAGLSVGRIDADDLGAFEIRGGELEADDYETALALVEEYNTIGWVDGDPEPEADTDANVDREPEPEPEADAHLSTDSDSDSEPGAEDGDAAEPESDTDDENESNFDADDFVDRTPMSEVTEDVLSGEYDDHLDEIEDAAERRGVLNAIEEQRGG